MKKKVQSNETAPWEDSAGDSQESTPEAAGLTPKKGLRRGNREVASEEPAAAAVEAVEKKGIAEKAPRRSKRPGSPDSDREEGNTASAGKPRRSASVLGYRWVMKNITFFLFLAGLAVVYIYNGHYADKISRDISRTNRELKELQYEYKTLRSEVMFRSKQSELARAVDPLGLKELTRPPYVLVDSAKN